MNQVFVADFDFREYLVIHAMYRRILETEPTLRERWQSRWVLHDAAATAFRLQLTIESGGGWVPAALMGSDAQWQQLARAVPLIKLIGPQAEPLQRLSEEQLLAPGSNLSAILREALGEDPP
eukprot:TRINITY_DN35270_c0_g1_i2.p5 TRINITY_DN35270_c0_g1~~TRINITY_DN35270_c0_g1_i2.p5  ORF type:complete len:122 (+),score=31.57 TRINITY_DN35270_c0_g1_i2:822-1187(+)